MSKFGILETLLLLSGGDHRVLQELPDYTSPPLPIALDATPEAYRSDDVIDTMRALAGSGSCSAAENRCHIPFPTPEGLFDGDSQVGVVFYPGGLVDPRGYSVIANILTTRYGLPTVIPVFNSDLAFTFGTCDSGRLDLAKAEFPQVEKWVLAGHSFGGIGAMSDMWSRWNDGDESAAGLAMLAADIRPDVGCGFIDFSDVDLPMASVTGSVDGVLNFTRWEANTVYFSNATQMLGIFGGTHDQFGAYDDSERFALLGQTDGQPLIPESIQWDLTAASIASVASRTGVPMPVRKEMAASVSSTEPSTTEVSTEPAASDEGNSVRCIEGGGDEVVADSSGSQLFAPSLALSLATACFLAATI